MVMISEGMLSKGKVADGCRVTASGPRIRLDADVRSEAGWPERCGVSRRTAAARVGASPKSGQSSPTRGSVAGVGAAAREGTEGNGHHGERDDSSESGASGSETFACSIHEHGDLLSTSDARSDDSAHPPLTSS